LVAEILRKVPEIPPVLCDLIVRKAEGNPFYIEELVKMLIEDGVIVPGEERWQVMPDRLAGVRVPPTLTGILQARLDRLPAAERKTLQQASVVGQVFWDSAVNHLEDGGDAENGAALSTTQARLAALRERELIFGRDTSVFAGVEEYIFKHVILHQVTYESVLMRLRRVYHAQVAKWLIARSGERVTEHASQIGEHYERAEEPASAVAWYERAGEQAQRTFANHEAIDYYSRALALIDDILASASTGELGHWQQKRFNLLDRRQEVYDRLGQRAEQASDLEQMLKLAGQLGEKQQARAHNQQSHYFWTISDYDQAVEAASRSLPLMQAAGDRLGEGEARRNLGRAARETGDYETAFEHFRAAAGLFEAAGARQHQGNALIQIGTLHSELGQCGDALGYLQEALAISRQIDSKWEEAWALDNIGIVYASTGDYGEALRHCREALTIARTIGSKFRELKNLTNVGGITAYLGDYEQAMDLFHEALNISRAIRDQSGEALALFNLGDFHGILGQYDEALAHLVAALNLATQLKRLFLIAACHCTLTVTYHRRQQPGDLDRAVEHAREAIAIAEQAGIKHYQVIGHSVLSMAHLARGEIDEALATTTRAVAQLEEIGTVGGAEQMVYFNHSQVLEVAGRAAEAGQALHRAQQMVREKAERISDPLRRRSFLERVPLNRQILGAAENQGQVDPVAWRGCG
jgi:tetratricopeptide (TPR) repeat protein